MGPLPPSLTIDTVSLHSSTIDAQAPTGTPSLNTIAYHGLKATRKITRSRRKKRVKIRAQGRSKSHGHTTTIDTLPDVVLRDIFYFCKVDHDDDGVPFSPILEWQRLVHVCRRWRYIIFGSPLWLDLQLLCTHGTPVRRNLGYWPPLPLIVDYYTDWDADEGKSVVPSYDDDIMAALEHPDRVRYVGVSVTSSLLEKMVAAIQEPFPMLTHLWLTSKDGDVPVLPERFFGGSAPRLRVAHFEGIPFPILPTLILSATNLVELQLINIPKTGYVPPDAMVAGLSELPRLETLFIGFQSTCPERRCRPPPTRFVLPSLSTFTFQGVNKYLENFLAHIDTPLLKNLTIVYFNQLITFYIPQLSHFITRTESLDLPRFKHARVVFGESSVFVNLYEGRSDSLAYHFALQISCKWFDWQIWHLTQLLYQSSNVFSHVDDLSIGTYDLHPLWRADKYVEPSEWPGLLCTFSGVKTLRVSKQLAQHVALALEGITGEKVAGTLPALHSLYLEGHTEGSVAHYIAARKNSGHPVNVSNTFRTHTNDSGCDSKAVTTIEKMA